MSGGQGRLLINIDVSSPSGLHFRPPSGNETKTNDWWILAGTLPTRYGDGLINNIPYGKCQENRAWH